MAGKYGIQSDRLFVSVWLKGYLYASAPEPDDGLRCLWRCDSGFDRDDSKDAASTVYKLVDEWMEVSIFTVVGQALTLVLFFVAVVLVFSLPVLLYKIYKQLVLLNANITSESDKNRS